MIGCSVEGMGTKVQYKSSLPGYYPMRDLTNDSDSRSWHLFYGERALTNTQYQNVFLPCAGENGYRGDDKDVVKQKMLEHEAIFKNQVFELHRLYRIQRDLMDKIKSSRLCRNRLPVDSSFSSSPLASQVTSDNTLRRNLPGFAMENSSRARLSTSVAKEGHYSLNSAKDNHQKPCFFPPQIGNTIRDPEVLESRPTKLRRKMFDLQLPPDEYIDSEDGEQSHDENVPDMLDHIEVKNQTVELENDVKLYPDDSQKTGRLQDASKSSASLANRSCLADLNEPPGSAYCHGQTQCPDPCSGPKSGLTDFHMKNSLNNRSDNVTANSLHLDSKLRSGGISPLFLKSGPNYSCKKFSSQGFQSKVWPISSQPTAPDFGNSLSNSNSSWESAKTNFQKSTLAQTRQCLNSAATLHENFRLPLHVIESFGERWHLGNDSRTDKVIDGEISYHNRSTLGSSSEYKDEVRHFSSISYGYGKRCSDSNRALEELTHGLPLKLFKDSNSMDMRCQKERNFNMVLRNCFSSEAEQKIGENCALFPWLRGTSAGNNETTNLGRLSSGEEPSYARSSMNCLPDQNGSDNSPSHIIHSKNSNSFHNDILLRKFKSGEWLSTQKLLGLPISEAMCDPKSEVEVNSEDKVVDINLPCDPSVTELDEQIAANDLDTEVRRETKVFRHLIDLNLRVSDDEASLRSTPKATVRMWGEIDLEAPAISETDDIVSAEEIMEIQHESASKPLSKVLSQQYEIMALAAEAIVAISSTVSHNYLEDATCNASQDSLENPLFLLVEMAISCGNDRARFRAKPYGDKEEASLEGMDSFESMTLGLTQTKEEEYMPRPLVPGHMTLDENATTLSQTRLRKGQARRGRQRRDFQRDILPGLASLSRHEVTEDLNTFGGIMRATGHLWNSGSSKRNSSRRACGRDRRQSVISPSSHLPVNLPLVHQLTKAEMRLEDRRLTGWGKTTRRPRRQRVPAGNLAAIPIVQTW